MKSTQQLLINGTDNLSLYIDKRKGALQTAPHERCMPR